MKLSFKKNDFLFLQKNLVEPLKRNGVKVYLFGSRAKGTNHPFSDVDVLLEGNINNEIDVQIIKIKDFFEDSNFPFKVDLVKFDDLAESYRLGILESRIEL